MNAYSNKYIGDVSIEEWEKAFAKAVNIAIEMDYFSDILFFDLYPDAPLETSEDYKKLWANVNEAFKEVFKYDRHGGMNNEE